MKQNEIRFTQKEESVAQSENTNKVKQEVKLNPISPESFKKYEILDLKVISSFDDVENNKIEQLKNIPYYFKREKIDELLKNESIVKSNLEKLLEHDDTYDYLQNIYLDELIKKLNTLKCNETERNRIIEKIQKSSIILPQNIYENKIKNIKLDCKEELIYNDYKKNLIETLTNIITKIKNKNLNESDITIAQNNLNIKKKFNFGQEPEFGDNNYYFYKLSLTFHLSMNNLFNKIRNYDYGFFIQKTLDLLKYEKEEFKLIKYKFQYLTNILLDPDFIKNYSQYNGVRNYVEDNDIDIFKFEKKINKIKNSKINYPDNAIKYDRCDIH